MTHSPGTWKCTPANYPSQREIRAADTSLVCRINEGNSLADGNARLIAAAPDLLAAAQAARDVLATAIRANWAGATDEDVASHPTIERLDIAIAKAKGD